MMTKPLAPLWIPTPEDVAAIRQILEENEATIAKLRQRIAELEAEALQRITELEEPQP